MLRNVSLTVIAALASAFAMSTAALAQEDCPRGTLDKAYCDRNGDLTADLPTDPKKVVNPSTLIFAYTPTEDPAVYQKAWDGFLKHLEKLTGKRVVFFPVQSNAAQYEAMRSGRLHIAGVNAGGNATAVNCAGFVPFAMMASADNSFGYEMEIVVPADSPIKEPTDLKGHKIAFTDAYVELRFQGTVRHPESRLRAGSEARLRAGFFRQARQLDPRRGEQGLRRGRGRQYGVQPDDRAQGVRPGEIRSIYKSETFPTTGYGTVYNLDPKLVDNIKKAFFVFPGDCRRWLDECKKDGKFFPIDYKKDWAVVRKIDERPASKTPARNQAPRRAEAAAKEEEEGPDARAAAPVEVVCASRANPS